MSKVLTSYQDKDLIQLAKDLFCNIEVCENYRPTDVVRYKDILAELKKRGYKETQPCIDFEKEHHDSLPERDHEIKISFLVQGYVVQRIHVINPEKYSVENIKDMLNTGQAVTTVREGGTVDITATGETIAIVVDVDNNLEYSNFEMGIPLRV